MSATELKYAKNQDEIRAAWPLLLDLPKVSKLKSASKGWTFAERFTTDGVTVQLHFQKTASVNGKSRAVDMSRSTPRVGLFTEDNITHLTPERYTIIAADPGIHSLLSIVRVRDPHLLTKEERQASTMQVSQGEYRDKSFMNANEARRKNDSELQHLQERQRELVTFSKRCTSAAEYTQYLTQLSLVCE